jgi:hypothetical protein
MHRDWRPTAGPRGGARQKAVQKSRKHAPVDQADAVAVPGQREERLFQASFGLAVKKRPVVGRERTSTTRP